MEIKLYEKNAKKHPDKQLKLIANSLQKYGWQQPIKIGEDNVIIAGHGRWLAYQKYPDGIKEAWIKDKDGKTISGEAETRKLTVQEEKEYRLADNKIAESDWDMELAIEELKVLDDLGTNIDSIGFDTDLIIEPEEKDDEVPELPTEAKAKLGEIYQLGNHRIMCGDSTKIEDVEKLMDGTYPDLVQTDPPYGMNAVSKSGVLSKNYDGDIIGDDNPDIAKEAFKLIYSMFPEAKHVWWGANYYCSVLPDSECWLVWDKNNGGSDQTDCELAWANFRSVVRQFTQSSEKVNRTHPTQKPVSLVSWIMRRFKFSSTTVADFFGGSGSTLIAAEKEGKVAFVMEYDPKYIDVIIQRYEEYTGNKAVKIVEDN